VLYSTPGRIDWNNMYASHRGVDEVDKGQYDAVAETSFVTGCSMMVKKVFGKIGFLDRGVHIWKTWILFTGKTNGIYIAL
jgi:hypothetical protein